MSATPNPNRRTLRIFVDTSVLFAAAYSASGSARDLIKYAIRGQIMLIISRDVADEVERNLAKKAPNAVTVYHSFLEVIGLSNVNPSQELIESVAQYVVTKDAPIVAAAISAQVDYLVTYDRKHLLDLPEVAQKSKLKIVTPDMVLLEIEKNDSETEDG